MATLRRVRKYQRGPAWYLDYNRPSGKRKQVSIGQISEEEAELRRQHAELRLNGQHATLPGAAEGPTFGVFASEYLAWYQTEYPSSFQRTEGICRHYLIPIFGPRPLGSINRRALEQYKAERHDKVQPTTVAKELNVVRAMLNRAVEWEYISTNYARGVRPPQNLNAQPAPCYTHEELERIYQNSPNKWAIWKLMVNTGLRRSEALNLKWVSVKEEALYVVSTSGARSKSKRYRKIPLSPGAKQAIAALRNLSPYVLPRMAPFSLSRAFRFVLNRAGIEGSLHALRHTFCSHLVMNGVDLRTVQELAGHASITTTMGLYAHLSKGHIQAAVGGLDL